MKHDGLLRRAGRRTRRRGCGRSGASRGSSSAGPARGSAPRPPATAPPSSSTTASPSRRPHVGTPSRSTRTIAWAWLMSRECIHSTVATSSVMVPPVASVESDFDGVQPIQAASVVSLAYDRIRALILSGDVAPGHAARAGRPRRAARRLAHAGPRGAAPPDRRGARRLRGPARLPRRGARARRRRAPAGGAAAARAGRRAHGRRARAPTRTSPRCEESIARERRARSGDRDPRRVARLPRPRRRGDAEPRAGHDARGAVARRGRPPAALAPPAPRRAGRTPTSRSTRRSSPRSATATATAPPR